VRRYVFHAAAMYDTGFLPPRYEWHRAAPCENDTTYLHKVIQVLISVSSCIIIIISSNSKLFSLFISLFLLIMND
jgi:hypothetical protein